MLGSLPSIYRWPAKIAWLAESATRLVKYISVSFLDIGIPDQKLNGARRRRRCRRRGHLPGGAGRPHGAGAGTPWAGRWFGGVVRVELVRDAVFFRLGQFTVRVLRAAR